MSNTELIDPVSHPEQFEFFAFVVDGEVATIFPVANQVELLIAAWSSNPTVIKLAPEQKNVVRNGDLLREGGTFVNPNAPEHGHHAETETMEPSERL